MKKQNRTARKGDIARTPAQSKAAPTATVRPKRKRAVQRSVNDPLQKEAERVLLQMAGSAVGKHGEWLTSLDMESGGGQNMYARGENYTLVTTHTQVRDGRKWRTWEEWSAQNPGVMPLDLPREKVRQFESAESLTREEVIAWLWENISFVCIPPTFQKDFRPGGLIKAASEEDADHYGNEIARFDDQRLFEDGESFHLVTHFNGMEIKGTATGGPGQTIQTLTREQVRAWLNDTVIDRMIPYEFHSDFRYRVRATIPASALALGEMLPLDSINELSQLGAEGIDIAAQVAGAVRSWLSYAEHLRTLPGGDAQLKAAPGVLDCMGYKEVHARARSSFITARGCEFYRSLLDRARRMPVAEAVEYLDGLADLIEANPALADEHLALGEFAHALYELGRSAAVKDHLDTQGAGV